MKYGAPIWNPHSVKLKEQLENVQRRATKYIPGFYDLTYPERLKKLKLPTLAYRRTRGDMIQVYKMLNGGYDTSLESLLKINDKSKTNYWRIQKNSQRNPKRFIEKSKKFTEKNQKIAEKYVRVEFAIYTGKVFQSFHLPHNLGAPQADLRN